jgi:hypothetical protein
VLIITGSMGSGKTTVMTEASDILAQWGVSHAAVDVDALGIAHFFSQVEVDDVRLRNLRCVWENYRTRGLTRLLLAVAVENRADLERLCEAVGASEPVVCRLTASVATMQQRVRLREIGMWQQKFVDRVAVLNTLLDGARLENFSVANENRPLSDVAREVLLRAGWIQGAERDR